MKEPPPLKDVRAFKGLGSYYRKFVPGFGKTAETLHRLLNKSNIFDWSIESKNAVTELKKKLLETAVLGYPSDRDPHTLTTDDSLISSGADFTKKQVTENRGFS